MSDLPLLLTGAGAIVAGLAAAVLIVWRDLAPVARLGTVGRLGLAAALGAGVLAFSVKFLAIELIASAGRGRLAPTLTTADPPVETDAIDVGRPVFEALPRQAPFPPDDPPTAEKIALGRRLFFDTALSADGSLACASCHDLDGAAGADGRRVAIGIGGRAGSRNTPTVIDAAFQARLFWDGRARSLEEQALGPITNPIEMGSTDLDAVLARLRARPEVVADFAAAFGPDAPIDAARLARALAAFERTLVAPDTRYDRFVRGETGLLDAEEIKGMALFERVGCIVCHAGPTFSRASLAAPDRGAGALRTFPALASPYTETHRLADDRGAATGAAPGPGVWRIPSLRDVARTAPYFHNGSVDDLAEAVRVMATVQLGRVVSDAATVEPIVEWSPERRLFTRRTPQTLSRADVAAIVAFLKTLSSDAPR